MGKDIFRKKALDKLSSPEQLDSIITITSSANWLAAIAFAIVVFVALIWGIYGKVPTKVRGTGILICGHGVTKIQTPYAGEISAINVSVGETIRKGQIIARLKQDELEEKIKIQLAKKDFLLKKSMLTDVLIRNDLNKEIEFYTSQESNLMLKIRELQDHQKWLQKRERINSRLRKKGAITEVELHKSEQERIENKTKLQDEKNKLLELIHKRSKGINDLIRSNLENQREIEEVEVQLQELLYKLKVETVIISKASGEIIEMDIGLNQIINKGDSLFTLVKNQRNTKMEAILFFPSAEGKKLSPGMSAQISPLTVSTQKFGYMRGIVSKVNKFPSSAKGINNMLQNESLVNQLCQSGPPIQAVIDLLPSRDTFSGYQWTSSKGPDIKIRNGTMCSAYVIVDEESPISFVVPFFKKLFLGVREEKIVFENTNKRNQNSGRK